MTPDRGVPQPAYESSVPVAPDATYRLQLQPDFPFAAAEAAVPYLASLGVSHLHLSPVLAAVPGSTHGYDIVDHSSVRAELGGEDGLRALAATAREHGLGLIVDIVPNHMAMPVPERLNRPLWEVLRDGPASPYARWFDIDWEQNGGRVLLPVLGGRLGDELPHFSVERTGSAEDVEGAENVKSGGAVLRYHDHEFPVRPGTEKLPLPELLDAQWYRLGWWRLARTELNYRRFFTISELIGVRVEEPEVFAATHAKLLELLRDGVVEGLRIDHPDGLADPGGYLEQLDAAVREAAGGPRWTVVEKILSGDEQLPASWPVAGTTGYDALRRLDGLFVDPAGLTELTHVYRDFAAPARDRGGEWAPTVRRAAHKVVTHELAAEVDRLVRTAARICDSTPALHDHAPWALRTAVRELLVRIPVYRPYATVGGPVSGTDVTLLADAAEGARAAFQVPEEAHAVEVVRDLALGRLGGGPDRADFCARFAQTSSALQAKSVEDTACYRYAPLLSAAEVGGDPDDPAVSAEAFHAYCARIQRDWPGTGTALSTHDTKRSADVRARIAALSECPERWGELLAEVTEQTARVDGVRAPDPHVAWVGWQTALGLGVPDPERLVPALLKAAREAALRTGWTERDAGYEEAVARFVEAGPCGAPLSALARFNRGIDPYVRANVLGAALLHLTMPGVPDLYQGTEREYAALVDPDNRRPAAFAPPLPAELFPPADPTRTTGRAQPSGDLVPEKLLLTATALRLRRERPGWFGAAASYEPLFASGPAAAHCTAFVRSGQLVSAVTRLPRSLERSGGWRGTRLPLPADGRWRELLTGAESEGPVRLGELFARYPVALLRRV
ncbi:malto-oligosyltrehalose synthase [Streptomyces sp. H27-D2]|uniref:malto-oligosyltrehalose synthase n=1 Tax=Streptomyces sp. H27-D2 TaxID=3046304 RepID=UPI002DB7113C|nr:malto-oligosyltrehalose synthase [Streptomyces sp. H27-D2]MEC4019210.1 malto-oligosyltrehalose synthase [Streptomyces sp. H27-D2]